MGVKNFLHLLIGIPFIHALGIVIIAFERAQGWIEPIQTELMYRLGVSKDKYCISILLICVFFWMTAFVISTLVDAMNRSKAWDNTTTRDCEEKQEGLSYRAYCGHLNEGEQFRFISVAVIISLILMNQQSYKNEAKLMLDFSAEMCTGYIIHRVLFHIMFILNINLLRSMNFAVSFWYSVLLFLSCIYGVSTMNNLMDSRTPLSFRELDIATIMAGFGQ